MKNKPLSAYEYLASTFTGMVARVVVAKSPKGELGRDIESLRESRVSA